MNESNLHRAARTLQKLTDLTYQQARHLLTTEKTRPNLDDPKVVAALVGRATIAAPVAAPAPLSELAAMIRKIDDQSPVAFGWAWFGHDGFEVTFGVNGAEVHCVERRLGADLCVTFATPDFNIEYDNSSELGVSDEVWDGMVEAREDLLHLANDYGRIAYRAALAEYVAWRTDNAPLVPNQRIHVAPPERPEVLCYWPDQDCVCPNRTHVPHTIDDYERLEAAQTVTDEAVTFDALCRHCGSGIDLHGGEFWTTGFEADRTVNHVCPVATGDHSHEPMSDEERAQQAATLAERFSAYEYRQMEVAVRQGDVSDDFDLADCQTVEWLLDSLSQHPDEILCDTLGLAAGTDVATTRWLCRDGIVAADAALADQINLIWGASTGEAGDLAFVLGLTAEIAVLRASNLTWEIHCLDRSGMNVNVAVVDASVTEAAMAAWIDQIDVPCFQFDSDPLPEAVERCRASGDHLVVCDDDGYCGACGHTAGGVYLDYCGHDDEDRCDTPGCDGRTDDGEGWDGYCGNCADKKQAAADDTIDDDDAAAVVLCVVCHQEIGDSVEPGALPGICRTCE